MIYLISSLHVIFLSILKTSLYNLRRRVC